LHSRKTNLRQGYGWRKMHAQITDNDFPENKQAKTFQCAGQKKLRARAGVNWQLLEKSKRCFAFCFCDFTCNCQESVEALFLLDSFAYFSHQGEKEVPARHEGIRRIKPGYSKKFISKKDVSYFMYLQSVASV